MNNAEVLKFVNEQVRPLAEKLRSLHAELTAIDLTYQGGIGAQLVSVLEDSIEDGRESEGVSRLTCNDVVNLMAQAEEILTQLNGSGVMTVISKPCVRPLQVQ